MKQLDAPGVPSRTDALVGREGIVTHDIEATVGAGRVNVGGEDWAARAGDADRRRHPHPGRRAPTASFWRSRPHDPDVHALRHRALPADRPDEGGQDRAAEAGEDHRAARQVPPHRRSRPQHDLSVPRLGARHDRPARADHQDRAAAGHHARQRDDGGRCGHLLRHRRSGAGHLRGPEPALGHRAAHALGAAQRRSASSISITRCRRATPSTRSCAPRSTARRSSGASR